MMGKVLISGDWNISEVVLNINGKYKPSKRLEIYIKKAWISYFKKFPDSFDGSMGRLKHWRVDQNKLKLDLELTNFSSYIATRAPNFSKMFDHSFRVGPHF